jgi:predicted DNA binding CopG/RHH family protein
VAQSSFAFIRVRLSPSVAHWVPRIVPDHFQENYRAARFRGLHDPGRSVHDEKKEKRRFIHPASARFIAAKEAAAYEKAEAFLTQDLSTLDFSHFKPAKFEFEKKDDQINMRVPKPLLEAVKARARARGIPYTRFIRETLEHAVAPK